MIIKDTPYREALDAGIGNDLANKYADYVQRKIRAIHFGRTNASFSDSSRNKVYASETAAMRTFLSNGGTIQTFANEGEVHKRFNQIIKSKMWAKLVEGGTGKGYLNPRLEFMRDQGSRTRMLGYAQGDMIKLSPQGFHEYTLIHELGHTAGNMHHDLGFRADLLKLVSRFISPDLAKCLKKEFKARKLKVTAPNNIKSAEEWYDSYLKMQSVRRAARKTV